MFLRLHCALFAHIDEHMKGERMPKMSVVVSDEVNRSIKKLAKLDRRSASEYIARLIESHVARKEAK